MSIEEGLICPECSIPLIEEDIKESLVCVECKTDLQNSKFLDFIEFLVSNGIVKDIDFFDMKIYKDEIERLDPTDQEEIDPQDFEKKKDLFQNPSSNQLTIYYFTNFNVLRFNSTFTFLPNTNVYPCTLVRPM